MRQQIDCAVLKLPAHADWVETELQSVGGALSRIRLHTLDWSVPAEATAAEGAVALSVQAFAKSTVSLRRYDLCLVPVTIDTLGWTRQALAAIPRGPFVPMIGIFKGLRSAAMQDLLELGLADFVRQPLDPDEFRARLLAVVTKMPRPGTLREPDGSPAAGWHTATTGLPAQSMSLHVERIGPRGTTSRPVQHGRPSRPLGRQGAPQYGQGGRRDRTTVQESFRLAKSQVVEKFEREYIANALASTEGNIAMAARASSKHRRAFWALMRKHAIDAAQYRIEDDEG